MAAKAALDYVRDGHVVGLGTGSTVKYFLMGLGERIKDGLKVQGVPTSQETATLASQLHIPLLPAEGDWRLDVTIDGADQVDPNLNLIKGGGGALLREKIVASASGQLIIIVDEAKCAPMLGHPWQVPVEVIPFRWPNSAHLLRQFGRDVILRKKYGEIYRTDSGNYILDLDVDQIEDPASLEMQLNLIPGVVENGLFVGRTSMLIVGTSSGIQIKHRQ